VEEEVRLSGPIPHHFVSRTIVSFSFKPGGPNLNIHLTPGAPRDNCRPPGS